MNRTVAATLVAVLSLSPLAAASWGMKGSLEPSTARDVSDGWMFPDATTQDHRVYFNGFVTPAGLYPANPGTSRTNTAFIYHEFQLIAIMGVWQDCNRDGYVGFGDGGLYEYRAELLMGDTSVCPPTPVPDPIPLGWTPPHNDGQWVHELTPIQWRNWNASETEDWNKFDLDDNASRIWADNALPERTGPPGSCAISPTPAGARHSTGGMLWYVDCFVGYKITDTSSTALAGAGLGSLSFGDHPRDQYNSASPLNQRNPWGEESDASYAQAWDCSQDQTPVVVDLPPDPVTNEPTTVEVANVSAPSTSPSPNAGGSAGGTANATYSGLDRCERRTDRAGNGNAGTLARLPYTGEAGANPNPRRTEPDQEFSPFSPARPAAPWSALGPGTPTDGGTGVSPSEARLNPGSTALPRDLGSVDNPGVAVHSDGVWTGNVLWTNTVGLNRATFEPSNVQYFTYYGYVSPAAVATYSLALPKGTATGTYGSDQCGTAIGPGAPDRHGWACDPASWYKDAAGASTEPRSTYLGPAPGVGFGARVGAPYNLRDIDCVDMSASPLREQGIALYGATQGVRCV